MHIFSVDHKGDQNKVQRLGIIMPSSFESMVVMTRF
jgi:hypothetical protein